MKTKTKTKKKVVTPPKHTVKKVVSTGPDRGRPFKAQGVGHQVMDKIMDERRGKKGKLGPKVQPIQDGDEKITGIELGKKAVAISEPVVESTLPTIVVTTEVFTEEIAADFREKIGRLSLVKAGLKLLGDEEKMLVDQIKEMCDGLDKTKFIDVGMPSVAYGFSKNTNIDVGRLLEKGVDADIIAYARGNKVSPMLTVDWKETVDLSFTTVDTILESLNADEVREDEFNDAR